MPDFKPFKQAVQAQFNKMCKTGLFKTNVQKDDMWTLYLNSFPDGTNHLFRENTEHDCNCCKSFIRQAGNIVSIVNNKLVSIWDISVNNEYQVVADVLSVYVKSAAICDIYLSPEPKVGVDYNFDNNTGQKWNHFFVDVPSEYVLKDSGSTLSAKRSTKEVFQRGLDELTADSINTVLELIDQNSLYRGEEHKSILSKFSALYISYSMTDNQDLFCWSNFHKQGSRIRNSVIGTLLVDLSDGMELDKAVGRFESKNAPENYKRPTALITKSMIANAQKKVIELGIQDALTRRYSTIDDITINNILFADRTVKQQMNVFDEISASVSDKPKNLDKVEKVSIDDFISNILPKAESIELLLENKHENNLVSLISPINADAGSILKWPNNFSWSYNGEVADSMKARVAKAGGRVDGVFRFTHSWNELEPNQSLMDLHVFMPGSSHNPEDRSNDIYGNGKRVGWNRRRDVKSGGVQDVDYVNQAPVGHVPIENITFPSLSKMPEGKYSCKIHNWNHRNSGGRGRAEIEFGGEIHQYEYPKTKDKQWITVASITLKDGEFTISHCLEPASVSKKVWNVSTEKFHRVSVIMNSPNHWDDNETGNKHFFFMLDNCLNPGQSRGFYNEFLSNDLTEHRKVFEVLGSKMKTEMSDSQLSGLGFSSTKRDSIYCKVVGSFSRTIKINF